MKNSARSTKMSYMLYIFGFALWRISMHQRRFIYYGSPDGSTLRARKTFTVLWRLITLTYSLYSSELGNGEEMETAP